MSQTSTEGEERALLIWLIISGPMEFGQDFVMFDVGD